MSDTAAHSHSRKQYWVIFGVLFVLTVAEVMLASMGVPHTPMVVGLVGLALTKASLVGLFFMHLRTEMRTLKLTVALPFAFPALYAFVLIAEAAWRYVQ